MKFLGYPKTSTYLVIVSSFTFEIVFLQVSPESPKYCSPLSSQLDILISSSYSSPHITQQ